MKTINKIIYPVSTKFGAPMGRSNVGDHPIKFKTKTFKSHADECVKLFDCAVPLDNGGYDKGGAYWGHGPQLRVTYTKDLTYINFYRK